MEMELGLAGLVTIGFGVGSVLYGLLRLVELKLVNWGKR